MPIRTGVPRHLLRIALAVLATLAALVIASGGGLVHAQQALVESQPAAGEELDESPTQITLTFDQDVGSANLVNVSCNSNPFTVGQPDVSEDNRTLTVEVPEEMPVGTCRVAWKLSEPSGEVGASGDFSFQVLTSSVTTPGQTTVPGGTTPADTDDTESVSSSDDDILDAADVSDGATWLGQVLSTLGLAVLFGSLVLIVAAWPEGPEYILAVRFLRSVWILTMAGTLLYVVALSAAVRGESFGNGLNPSGWLDLFDAGLGGQAALARLVLVIASVWVVLRPERVIDPTTQLPAIAIPTLAVVTLGLTRTGGDLAILGVIAGVAHALAMAVWLGGVVLLARVVLAGPGEEDLVHAVRGFNRISGPAIVVTVLSGLVQLYRLDGGSLFNESHGRVLLLKTVLVAIMLFVGLTARQVAQARLARVNDLSPPMADRLRRAFGTEAAIGVVVLALSGWLLALEPGKLPAADQPDYAIEETVVDPALGIDLTVALDPGQVGLNELRVEVREPATDLTGLEVTFAPPVGSNAASIVQTIPLTGAGIAVSAPGGGIPLDVPGAWTMQVSATTPLGPMTNAASSFEVRNSDGSLPTSDIGTTPTAPAATAATTSIPVAATTTP